MNFWKVLLLKDGVFWKNEDFWKNGDFWKMGIFEKCEFKKNWILKDVNFLSRLKSRFSFIEPQDHKYWIEIHWLWMSNPDTLLDLRQV